MGAANASALAPSLQPALSALGHSLPIHSGPVPPNVRYAPKATVALQCSERRDVPIGDIRPIQSVSLLRNKCIAKALKYVRLAS